MSIIKGYRQVLNEFSTPRNTVDFDIVGSGLIVGTTLSGTWQLALVAPDDNLIPLLSDLSAPFQQAYDRAPQGTKLRFYGGTKARLWVGLALNTPEGLLI